MRKKVFICSPFRGDMEGNARKAAAYSRMACEEGHLPIAPHLLFPQFLNEGIEEERRLGIAMGMELLALCDEVWVFGEATEGMAAEITSWANPAALTTGFWKKPIRNSGSRWRYCRRRLRRAVPFRAAGGQATPASC